MEYMNRYRVLPVFDMSMEAYYGVFDTHEGKWVGVVDANPRGAYAEADRLNREANGASERGVAS